MLDALDHWKQKCAGAAPGSQQHSTCLTRTAPKIQIGHLEITRAVLQAGID
ncbi:hypothetical protein FHR84_001086 [Actinopolyspora biskrensis]|uniref:Uncharacterized protein n=1 Tax=Actinopolyspora biskrensis TaxID=1470178 RepID=A0A852YVM0_9ACTN|nr:hypothetical protein [Actinopolyspora biskrensis]NYH77772.1 hypothetical protein [Actinopolyspora biskrensis]